MSEVLRLGIAGLGTVGVGVIKLVANNADTLTARAAALSLCRLFQPAAKARIAVST